MRRLAGTGLDWLLDPANLTTSPMLRRPLGKDSSGPASARCEEQPELGLLAPGNSITLDAPRIRQHSRATASSPAGPREGPADIIPPRHIRAWAEGFPRHPEETRTSSTAPYQNRLRVDIVL